MVHDDRERATLATSRPEKDNVAQFEGGANRLLRTQAFRLRLRARQLLLKTFERLRALPPKGSVLSRPPLDIAASTDEVKGTLLHVILETAGLALRSGEGEPEDGGVVGVVQGGPECLPQLARGDLGVVPVTQQLPPLLSNVGREVVFKDAGTPSSHAGRVPPTHEAPVSPQYRCERA